MFLSHKHKTQNRPEIESMTVYHLGLFTNFTGFNCESVVPFCFDFMAGVLLASGTSLSGNLE